MIFASSLKPNGKMRFSATAGWTQVANGLRLTSTASAASVELHSDYGGLSLYNQQDFSIGVKIDRAPVTITNGIATNNNNYLAFAFTALGMLTITRGFSSPTITQINLTELGVDISKGIDLVQHWHYDEGVQVLDVYVNEVPVMLGSTRSPLQTTYTRISVAAGAPAPVTLSEIYVKAGDPLLSWKVQDCQLAVDNAQAVYLGSSIADSVIAARDMRIAYTLVADGPPAEEVKEVIIEATVPQVKSSVGDKQNLRVAFAGKLLVDKGKLVNPEYGNQFTFNDLSHEEVASPVVVTMSNERLGFGTLRLTNVSMYSVVDPVAGVSGIYTVIAPDGTPFNAYVDMVTDGGFWILSHRWISLNEAYTYNDMVVAGRPIKSVTTDASIYPCIPSGFVCATPYILLKHTESRWVASMTEWVKFSPLAPNTKLGSTGFEAINANGDNIRLYGRSAGWRTDNSMDDPFGIMTEWGPYGLCGGQYVVKGAICPVAYPNPSGSHFDNSNVKEIYYKGVAVTQENLKKVTKPFAYFRFAEGSKDDVTSAYAVLSNATVSAGKLQLEGSDLSYMELPAFIPSKDFTIEMKFNPTEASGKLIEVGNLLDIEIDTSLKFRMGAGKIATLDSEVSVTLSQECHVAVSSRNGVIQMFVDGVPTARGISYGRLDPAQVKTLIGRGFKGTISDIRLSFDGLYVVGFEVQPLSEYTPDDPLDLNVLLQEEFLEGSEYGEL